MIDQFVTQFAGDALFHALELLIEELDHLAAFDIDQVFVFQLGGVNQDRIGDVDDVVREEVQQEPVAAGARLRGRRQTKVLQSVETHREEGLVELRFLKFALPMSFRYFEKFFDHRGPEVRLVHRETRLVAREAGRSGGDANERFLLPYLRLEVESDDQRYRLEDLVDAGGEELSEFELFWVRKKKGSRLFEVEIEVAGFQPLEGLRERRW